MKQICLMLGLVFMFVGCGKAEPKGNIEREKFMRSILLADDAFEEGLPVLKQIQLLDQTLAKAREVNLEFLDFVSPGLGNAWKDFIMACSLRASGLRKNEAGNLKEGLLEQLQGSAFWEKWEGFWLPHKLAVFKKLKVGE